MQTYLALLRGINVGGKSKVSMADLRDALVASGLDDVRTYIQSGNVIFSAEKSSKTDVLAAQISKVLSQKFKLDVAVVVFSKDQWSRILAAAPKWWGVQPDWKHNLLVVIPPGTVQAVLDDIGELKPDIEKVEAGSGVVYQSMLFTKFGQTSSGKLASRPAYKTLTIRNYNTATKLMNLL